MYLYVRYDSYKCTVSMQLSLYCTCDSVRYILSVRGVMTNLPLSPMYSYPYPKAPVHCLTINSSSSFSQ